MDNEFMNLVAKISADSAEFQKAMSDVDSSGSKFGSAMKGVGIAAGVAFTAATAAVGAAGTMIASTIAPASDLSETVSKVGVVFGSSSEKILKWGETTSTAMGMSSNTALAAAGTYGNLFRAMGMTEEVSGDMSMSLVQLAGDLASFNNSNPQDVLDALRSGLSGETEPLKKLGVNLNQAMIEQKALTLGLWDGESALTAGAKAQATYALVMEQTTLAQGDYERTSQGLANTQRSLGATFEDIKAGIGTAFLPIIENAAGIALDFAGGLKSIVKSGAPVGEMFANVGKLIQDYMGDVMDMLNEILPGAVGLIMGIVKGIVGALPALLPALVQIFMTLVTAIVELLPTIIDAGFQLILALSMGIASALPTLIPSIVQMMISIVLTIVENIPLLIDAALQIVLGLVNGIIAALPVLIQQLPVIVQAVITAITNSLPLLFDAALQLILALVEGVIMNLPALLEAGVSILMELIAGILQVAGQLVTLGLDLWKKLDEGLDVIYKNIKEAGVNLMKSMWEGIKSQFSTITTNFLEFFRNLIAKIKEMFDMHSPSRVMFGLGKNMMLGLNMGLEKYSGFAVESSLSAMTSVAEPAGRPSDSQVQNAFSYPSAQEIGRAVAVALMQTGAIG